MSSCRIQMSKRSLLLALLCELDQSSDDLCRVWTSTRVASLIVFDAGTATRDQERMSSALKGQQSKKKTSQISSQNAFRRRSICQEASSSCPDCQCPRLAVFLSSVVSEAADSRSLQAGKVLRRELRKWALEELGDANGNYHAESFSNGYEPSRNYSVRSTGLSSMEDMTLTRIAGCHRIPEHPSIQCGLHTTILHEGKE
jgi:hypothetical protein